MGKTQTFAKVQAVVETIRQYARPPDTGSLPLWPFHALFVVDYDTEYDDARWTRWQPPLHRPDVRIHPPCSYGHNVGVRCVDSTCHEILNRYATLKQYSPSKLAEQQRKQQSSQGAKSQPSAAQTIPTPNTSGAAKHSSTAVKKWDLYVDVAGSHA